ncbi:MULTISPECIES: ABC transporter ATP-binding protein [unclassified Rhizobium]|uniref:ABC transporter ATP-binding protein n=1 Tax=unclassified Rhizobium TaxID=2613769 RepID=UPI0006F25F47|nr:MULTISPECIES: ABC transporter ATP-binding protein [unclassified Rhizobium]KQV36719.1 ABC transporter ATP-binding protein [Rhizobium sp. Root1212]KRD28537.1 ABC transporter ATP-binding protein [Rhizobium sp. Root268]
MISAVEFQSVGKSFGETVALDNISFSVKPGETIALLGPSGCGKTTILRLIAGFERPDSGTITIGGKSMAGLKPYERNVGLLFQHYALFPHMTVEQNIGYGLRHRGHAAREIPARVAEMLDLVRLTGFGHRRPNELSGGQQQRVALARALATHPSLLLLDEPLSALDAKLRHELRTELKDVLAAVGSTAIVVTHDQEEAMSLGERIFVMSRGEIMQSGKPDDVYWRPKSRFVADFMGRTNWIRGSVVATDGSVSTFRSEFGWEFPVAASRDGAAMKDVCVRPESVEISSGTGRAGAIGMAGRVEDVVTLGAFRHVSVELSSGDRIISACANRPDISFEAGQEITISMPPQACVLFA